VQGAAPNHPADAGHCQAQLLLPLQQLLLLVVLQ
jgi:hypothetical protein